MIHRNNLFGTTSRRLIYCGSLFLAGVLPVPAQNPVADTGSKVEALLAKMTLDEKIGQMVQVDSGALKDISDVQKYCIGSVLSGGSSDPAGGNSAQSWLDSVKQFQDQALQTRLKIPLIYGIDAVHGHNNIDGAVIFPHHIGMGATHDPKPVSYTHLTLPTIYSV